MDQNRSETSPNQQQNVHLHMHHVCNCQGSIYPTYYPAIGYRTPVPPIVSYPTPPSISRPYMQHYQYTQFNMGSQYGVPLSHVAPSGTMYGGNSSSSTMDMIYGGGAIKDRRDREEGSGDVERVTEQPEGFYYGLVTPPASELLITEDSETATTENFVKFLERSCHTAEQIAYRNRNRPCFRNIQNLCIRTRSEILKPCTTISNIHSQGIPWATKDFIYAFVRLTNCWHILKGYWENRDGSSLGKIEKELTPEFRACYVRWEKETIELAGQLTRVFYNLDTNLNTSNVPGSVYSANLIPPQVNLLKSTLSESTIKETTSAENSSMSTLTTAVPSATTTKNVRGILHLPTTSQAERIDQGNQTCAGDLCNKEECDSEEERSRVYMKPGSYNVPKKGPSSNDAAGANSPRAIEFLETAQNVNKVREANDRYWANIHVGTSKKAFQEDEKASGSMDIELNLSSHFNVHEWLISSNFSDYGDTKSSPTTDQELRSFYVENSVAYDTMQLDGNSYRSSVTRGRTGANQKNLDSVTAIGSRTFHRKKESTSFPNSSRQCAATLENKGGGITEIGVSALKSLVLDMKKLNIINAVNAESDKMDLDDIFRKLKNMEYIYVNEVIRDLKYVIKNTDKIENTDWFSQKLEHSLREQLTGFEFADIKGELNECVGPLKMKLSFFNSDGDQFI